MTADDLLKDVYDNVASAFALMDAAEEEILAAQLRHGERPPDRDPDGRVVGERGPLWRAFRLLSPTRPEMAGFVHRSHCRELLDRVARGDDTRPATDAELCLALKDVTLATPVRSSTAGLYRRLFTRAFPEQAAEAFDGAADLDHYEALHGEQMDEDEAWIRRRLAQDWRRADVPGRAVQLVLDD
jgi:hypothetical protein